MKYVIYGNRCGKTNKPVKLAEISDKNISNFTIKEFAGRKLRKGTYTVTVLVTAAGDKNHNAASRYVSFRIRVK